MTQQLAFIATDNSGRIRYSERQLIRSHCMRRRNKNPGSRRSKREAARAAAGYSSESKEQGRKISFGPEPISTKDLVTSQSTLSVRESQSKAANQECILSLPRSDWALFAFPEELGIYSQKLMHQCK